jgi:pilus assembly protein FimV
LDNSSLNRILPKDTFYAPPAETDTAAGQGEDWLGDIDDALSFLDFPDDEIDLHEAHISTKLDLARAYLDMGDIEGARSTLEEVMVEGNDDQRREAEVLLHQTG